MSIDWPGKLRNLLQVVAFCLLIAALQYGFNPARHFAPPLAYSLLIGIITWAGVDLGRHLFPSSAQTGWPQGWAWLLLMALAIAAGYLVGGFIADTLSAHYSWYPPGSSHPDGHLRRSLLISLIAGITGSYWFYSRGKSAWLLREMNRERQHATEARLKLLESQLEPHMLFNTLANLRALIGSDPQQAQKMLDHLIDYLRATLNASRSTTHALSAEFDRLRDYLELMAIRMGPRLSYSFDLPADLAAQPVPPLLLQPLVENSIRHGLEPKIEGGRVQVSARREGPSIVIEVLDTGVGSAPATTGAGGSSTAAAHGFGMTQVRERLQTLHGAAASLEFESTRSLGACARVRFPALPT